MTPWRDAVTPYLVAVTPCLLSDCHRTEDLAASLLRNQCSDLVELAATYARAKGIRHVVFSGSYVEHDVTTALFQQLLAVKTLQSAEEVGDTQGERGLLKK